MIERPEPVSDGPSRTFAINVTMLTGCPAYGHLCGPSDNRHDDHEKWNLWISNLVDGIYYEACNNTLPAGHTRMLLHIHRGASVDAEILDSTSPGHSRAVVDKLIIPLNASRRLQWPKTQRLSEVTLGFSMLTRTTPGGFSFDSMPDGLTYFYQLTDKTRDYTLLSSTMIGPQQLSRDRLEELRP